MNIFEYVTAVPGLTAICLLAAQLFKTATPIDHKHIPTFCGVLGALIGVLSFYLLPGYLPAENLPAAVAIGAVSGWAATGVHQTGRQYMQ